MRTYRVRNPLRAYFAVRDNPIPFLLDVVREYGDCVRIELPTLRFHLINDPEMVRSALVEKNDVLILKGGAAAGLARLIGDGILTNHGDRWRESRRGLQPLFNQNAVETYPSIIRNRVQESIDRWKSGFSGKPFSLNREVLALSFRITCSTLFKYLPDFEESLEFADAIWILQSDGMNRYTRGLDRAQWLPLPLNRKVARAKKKLAALANQIRQHGAEQPVDEIISILFAGTESPANTICWALILLDEHPSWHGKLAQFSPEADEGFDVLSQVLSETMRLYPAGWAFERFATEDTQLGDTPIEKGSRLLFSPFLLHRNPRFWKNPETFDPSRFTSYSTPDGVPKYAYLPFGAGPRSCIGSRVAWIEMRIMLSMLAALPFKFHSDPKEPRPEPTGSFKIRLNRPVFVTI